MFLWDRVSVFYGEAKKVLDDKALPLDNMRDTKTLGT